MDNDYLVETMDQHFLDFSSSRRDSVFQSAQLKDKKYIEVREKCSDLHRKVEAIIPKELYEELEETTNEEASISENYVYKQGFFDGIRLMQMQNELINAK